jgi:hypothetical protein
MMCNRIVLVIFYYNHMVVAGDLARDRLGVAGNNDYGVIPLFYSQ